MEVLVSNNNNKTIKSNWLFYFVGLIKRVRILKGQWSKFNSFRMIFKKYGLNLQTNMNTIPNWDT